MITDVKPFDEVWFRDCFHMSIIPVFEYIFGTYNDILYNQIGNYIYNCGIISWKYFDNRNIYEMLDGYNVDYVFNPRLRKKSEFIAYLNNDYFIILGIDSFFEKEKVDCFGKYHTGHSILIYKYNFELDEFYCIDQPFNFSYLYKKTRIKFDDLLIGHQSYIKHLNDEKFFQNPLPEICRYNGEMPSVLIISSKKKDLKRNKNVIPYFRKYIDKKRTDDLRLYLKDVENLVRIKQNISKFTNEVNKIINGIRLENYILSKIKLFNNKYFISLLNKRYIYWNKYRNIVLKRSIRNDEKVKHVSSDKEILLDILLMEEKILDYIHMQIEK